MNRAHATADGVCITCAVCTTAIQAIITILCRSPSWHRMPTHASTFHYQTMPPLTITGPEWRDTVYNEDNGHIEEPKDDGARHRLW